MSLSTSTPSEVLGAATEWPMVMHGVTVRIARVSCHCGGDFAWERQNPTTGLWEMAGCVCHNPAVGP